MSAAEPETGFLTLEELTDRVGMSVRNVRFYTSRGLVPPPIRMGRSGYYSEDHVVRLELVSELQSHGFTLSAIERYLARIPEDASPETVALHRTLIAPSLEPSEVVDGDELERRAGRTLTDLDLHLLEELGVLVRDSDGFTVSGTHLTIGLAVIDAGFPLEAARATREVYKRHGREIAEELTEIFRTQVRPALDESGTDHDALREVLQRINAMSIAALVTAYQESVEDLRRESAARKSR